MSKYYLDCEFDGFEGQLLSMALVCEDGRELYWQKAGQLVIHDEWVKENVMPIMSVDGATPTHARLTKLLAEMFAGDDDPIVIADWPDDFTYLCPEVLTGPGTMIDIPSLKMEVIRVDAYPTDLEGAVQHNALWDARALKRKIEALKIREVQS